MMAPFSPRDACTERATATQAFVHVHMPLYHLHMGFRKGQQLYTPPRRCMFVHASGAPSAPFRHYTGDCIPRVKNCICSRSDWRQASPPHFRPHAFRAQPIGASPDRPRAPRTPRLSKAQSAPRSERALRQGPHVPWLPRLRACLRRPRHQRIRLYIYAHVFRTGQRAHLAHNGLLVSRGTVPAPLTCKQTRPHGRTRERLAGRSFPDTSRAREGHSRSVLLNLTSSASPPQPLTASRRRRCRSHASSPSARRRSAAPRLSRDALGHPPSEADTEASQAAEHPQTRPRQDLRP